MISEVLARRALDENKGRLQFPFVDHCEVKKTEAGNYIVVAFLRRSLKRGEYVPSPLVVNDFGQSYRVIVKTQILRGQMNPTL